jgi:hypothetical protein
VKIFFEGRRYDSVHDLPAEGRQKYEQAMRRLDTDRDGIPDVARSFWSDAGTPARAPAASPLSPAPTSEPEGISAAVLVAGLAILIAVMCAGAVAVLLLR